MVRARLRARRTKFGVSATPMARISLTSEPPSAVTMISASSRVGKAISMSAPRMMSVSTRPPERRRRCPAAPPARRPKTTEASPTSSDTRAPQMMRLRMSRPNSSVPSRWRSTAPGPLSTASENCADGLMGAMSGAAAAIDDHGHGQRQPDADRAATGAGTAAGVLRGSSLGPGTVRSTGSARANDGHRALLGSGLPVGDPRVDDGVEHVDDQVDR